MKFNGRKRRDLRAIQKWGVNRIFDHETTILAWDMGAGKTVTVLTAADDLLEERVVRKVLIVAPMLVAKATFPDEFSEWKHLSHIDWTLIRVEDEDEDVLKFRKRAYDSARKILGMRPDEASRYAGKRKTCFKEWKRQKLALDGAEVHIINKESLVWLWEFFGNGKKWPYDMLIFDESSMFKNGSRRTKLKSLSLFGAAAKARKYARRVVQMTGTPAPKGLRNLWGIAYVADLGDRLGTSRTKFEKKYFETDYMGWNLEARPKSFEQITEKLSDIMFSLHPEDYADLPPMLPKMIKVDLPRKALEEYRRFERTLVSELYDIEAVNRGVLTGKLLQFANGSMYNEDGDDVWIHDEKLFALEELVDRLDGETLLVGYSFKFDLKRIKKRFKHAKVFGEGDVRKMKADWNAGKIDMMLAHPNQVGHGQNLQFGGHNMAWYGMTPDLELYQQFNKRLHRPGQTRKVTNWHIVARGTYDERMLDLLSTRDADQEQIMKRFRLDLMDKYRT